MEAPPHGPPTGPSEGSAGNTPDDSFDRAKANAQASEVAGYGITMAVATALFAWGGTKLDARLGTAPLFVLLGAFLGFGGGFYSMYRHLVRPSSDGSSTPREDE